MIVNDLPPALYLLHHQSKSSRRIATARRRPLQRKPPIYERVFLTQRTHRNLRVSQRPHSLTRSIALLIARLNRRRAPVRDILPDKSSLRRILVVRRKRRQ